MAAPTINLTEGDEIDAGSTYRRIFQFLDSAGAPADLTLFDPVATSTAEGASAAFRLTVDTSGSSLLSLISTADIDHEGCYILQPPTLGQVQILVFAATSATLSYTGDAPLTAQRSGTWDIELKGIPASGSGPTALGQETERKAQGGFSIDPENTRPTL